MDEGEYIGDAGTAHLRELFPALDDPELVERFKAEIATRRPVETPAHVQERGGGFALGGDRSSLRLHDAHVDEPRADAEVVEVHPARHRAGQLAAHEARADDAQADLLSHARWPTAAA